MTTPAAIETAGVVWPSPDSIAVTVLTPALTRRCVGALKAGGSSALPASRHDLDLWRDAASAPHLLEREIGAEYVQRLAPVQDGCTESKAGS